MIHTISYVKSQYSFSMLIVCWILIIDSCHFFHDLYIKIEFFFYSITMMIIRSGMLNHLSFKDIIVVVESLLFKINKKLEVRDNRFQLRVSSESISQDCFKYPEWNLPGKVEVSRRVSPDNACMRDINQSLSFSPF